MKCKSAVALGSLEQVLRLGIDCSETYERCQLLDVKGTRGCGTPELLPNAPSTPLFQ